MSELKYGSPEAARIGAVLQSEKVCPWCSAEFDCLFENERLPNLKWAVHAKQTHGYEPEDIMFMAFRIADKWNAERKAETG